MARRKRRHKEDGLASEVFKSKPLRDEKGRYVPFCDFGYHQGISLKPEVCEQRNCMHYKKLYIPKPAQETTENNR